MLPLPSEPTRNTFFPVTTTSSPESPSDPTHMAEHRSSKRAILSFLDPPPPVSVLALFASGAPAAGAAPEGGGATVSLFAPEGMIASLNSGVSNQSVSRRRPAIRPAWHVPDSSRLKTQSESESSDMSSFSTQHDIDSQRESNEW